jgi:hypothetical protein
VEAVAGHFVGNRWLFILFYHYNDFQLASMAIDAVKAISLIP